MEKLLKRQQIENQTRRKELEQTVTECRGQLDQRSRETKEVKGQLVKCQEVSQWMSSSV